MNKPMNVAIKALYKCDPSKNIECPKKGCFKNGGDCRCTINAKCAEIDENGMPILSETYLELFVKSYIRSYVREGTAVLIKP